MYILSAVLKTSLYPSSIYVSPLINQKWYNKINLEIPDKL